MTDFDFFFPRLHPMCQPVTQRKKVIFFFFHCHCVFQYSSLRSCWLLRSESSTALMGWFGIQLNAGSYFGMPDKVFWWRTIAAASGDSLMVYGWEHTLCLWLHKTMHYVLLFPYHTISHNTTDSVKQHQDPQHCLGVTTTQDYTQPKFYFCSLKQNEPFQNTDGLFSEKCSC